MTERFKNQVLLLGLRLFRQQAATERIARGFALGLIVNFLPTFGFSLLISGLLARLLGGNLVAGFVGGASLTLAWPLLYLLNIKVGSLFHRPEIAIDDVSDITESNLDALMWGQTFLIGALINCLIIGLLSYFAMMLLYERVRPHALQWLREQSRRRHHRD